MSAYGSLTPYAAFMTDDSAKGRDRECRDQSAAFQRMKFDQDATVSRSRDECAIHCLELAAGRREDVETREHDLSVDPHIEFPHAGRAGGGLLKLQGHSVASARHRYAIRELSLPKAVVHSGI